MGYEVTVSAALLDAPDLPVQVRSVGRADWTDGLRRSRATAHEFWELLWTVSGEGWVRLADDSVPLTLGAEQAILLSPETFRQFGATPQGWRYRWLTLIGPQVEALVHVLAPALTVARIGRCPEAVFERLTHLLRNPDDGAKRRALGTAVELLTAFAAPPRPRGSALIEEAKVIIQEELNRSGLNVNALSRRLGVDRSVLSRRFRAETGRTPSAYLAARRLEKAMALLAESDDPISRIAAACGYPDADTFSRLFRRHLNLSPSRYRREKG